MITDREVEEWIIKIAIVLVFAIIALGMGGCAQFENRIACTVSGDKAYLVSEYMRVGISAEVAARDAQRVCAAAPGTGASASK